MAKATSVDKDRAAITRIVFCGIAVFLILITSISVWMKNNIFDSQNFASQMRQTLQEEPVRQAIGNEVAGKIYQNNPIIGRVLTEPTASIVAGILGRDRVGDLSEKIFEKLNQRIINGDSDSVDIDISGFVTTVQSLRQQINPDAQLVFPEGANANITLLPADSLPNLKRIGQVVLLLTPFSTIALGVLFILTLIKSRNKWDFVWLSGLVLVISMIILMALTYTLSTQLSLSAQNANQTVILESLFNNFTANLQHFTQLLLSWGILIIIIGYVGKHWKKIRSWFRAVRKQQSGKAKAKS